MSITHELREWISSVTWLNDGIHHTCDKITSIADRIDAEHEEAIQQVLIGEGGVPATDENMAEHGWVRLPKDADGKYIHIGDVMDFTKNVRDLTVVGIGIVDASESSLGVFVPEGHDYVWYNAEFLHHRVPTVENVLREFALAVCKDDALTIRKDVVDEYAAKLRLAGDEE